ncbi:MAG: 3-methyl-2-oxobutanoate hydroxymethyltransferase [Alteromonas macleodii]
MHQIARHVGFSRYLSRWARTVSKTLEQAKTVWNQVQAFENAGVFAVEIEVIAESLAA